MKKNLLVVGVSSAALLFAASAYADGGPIPEEAPPPPPEPVADEPEPAPVYEPAAPEYKWYTTVFAGAVFGDSVDLDASSGGTPLFDTFEVPMDTGYLLGWTLGYDNMFDSSMIQIRPEVELSFRQQDVDLDEAIETLAGPGVPASEPLNLAVDMLTVMGNVWADFDLGGGFTPYAGGGIGIGFADFGIIESEDFVWQFGGGVNFDVNERVFLGVGYRYLAGDFEESTDLFGLATPPLDLELDYQSHEVMANLGVRF